MRPNQYYSNPSMACWQVALSHSRTGCWRSRRLSMEGNISCSHANRIPLHRPVTWWLITIMMQFRPVQDSSEKNMFHCHFITPKINGEVSLKAVRLKHFVAGISFPFHRARGQCWWGISWRPVVSWHVSQDYRCAIVWNLWGRNFCGAISSPFPLQGWMNLNQALKLLKPQENTYEKSTWRASLCKAGPWHGASASAPNTTMFQNSSCSPSPQSWTPSGLA